MRVLAAAIAVSGCAYVIVAPPASSRYPLMTDAPFHAANASVLRHYWDDAWHFREQFVLQPFAVPYLTLYLLAAVAMTWMSAASAIVCAATVMLALFPAGLATLSWGMKKSPLLGLASLPLVWCGLTSRGFLNFVARWACSPWPSASPCATANVPARRAPRCSRAC
jgi:hypothetical protein